MSCQNPICQLLTCEDTESIPSYLGSFSLQNGLIFTNPAMYVPVTYGNGFYYVPPNTIKIPVAPGATWISYQGCQSTVSAPIPAGSTPAEIRVIMISVMFQLAQQLAICNAPSNPHVPSGSDPSSFQTYQNTAQTGTCSATGMLKVVGALPNGLTASPTQIICAAGVFTSDISQADADETALLFVINFIESAAVQCGFWNTPQTFTCTDGSSQTIPANTVFSQVSQADADSQALALAGTHCGGLISNMVWTKVHNNLSCTSCNTSFVNCSGNSGTLFGTADGTQPSSCGCPPFTIPTANVQYVGHWINSCSHPVVVTCYATTNGNSQVSASVGNVTTGFQAISTIASNGVFTGTLTLNPGDDLQINISIIVGGSYGIGYQSVTASAFAANSC